MKIFEFTHYKKYVLKRLETMPGRGRGELSRIAEALGVHSTMVTHVFKGSAQLSLEQSLKLADHFAFNELETDYLVALVQWERAGDKRAREFCAARVQELKERALNIKQRLGSRNELSEEDRHVFYATWIPAHIRLLTAVKRFQTFEALVKELKLPPKTVRKNLDFLVSRGLCREEGGRIEYAPLPTYIEAGSPLAVSHHLNWRRKTQDALDRLRQEDLVFTYPTVITEADFQKIREQIVQLIEEFKKATEPSPAEDLYCLNIDWVKLS